MLKDSQICEIPFSPLYPSPPSKFLLVYHSKLCFYSVCMFVFLLSYDTFIKFLEINFSPLYGTLDKIEKLNTHVTNE